MLLLSLQKSAFSFVAVYLGIYLFLGGGSVAESTLLNQAAPASHRAGILSLSSLVLQIGGLIAALCGYFISTYSRFQNIWLVSGALLLVCVVCFWLTRKAQSPVEAQNTPDLLSSENG